MTDDLAALYADPASQIPETPEEEFDFTEEILVVPPAQLSIGNLLVEKHQYRYGGYYAVDSVWFHARHDTFRQLALLVLASIFHAEPSPVRLDLTHTAAGIKHILLEHNYKEDGWRGFYWGKPYRVRYHAASYEDTVAWWDPDLDLNMDDRLSLRLTNVNDSVSTEEEYEQRDAIWLHGNDRALTLLADFLLNIGRPQVPDAMFTVEGSGEAGGYLGTWSAEARFILPGHNYWRAEAWTN